MNNETEGETSQVFECLEPFSPSVTANTVPPSSSEEGDKFIYLYADKLKFNVPHG